MKILGDVLKELLSMFIPDARLALSIIGLILFAAFLLKIVGGAPLVVGSILLVGCLVILVVAVCREAVKRKS